MMLQMRSLTNLVSGIFGKYPINSGYVGHGRQDVATSTEDDKKLQFHPIHDETITLCDNQYVARRNENYFEHATVFSHRPISVDEILAVEITEISPTFHGPPRVGFTTIDPCLLQSDGKIPLGQDLRKRAGVWLKSVHAFQMTAGLVMYFKIDINGNVWYGINGEQQGSFLNGVDTSKPLWAILELYGEVQAVKLTNKTMVLLPEQIDAEQYQYSNMAEVRITRSGTRTRRLEDAAAGRPLFARRNMRVDPIKTPSINVGTSEFSAKTPSYSTPGLFDDPKFARGLCIICTDKESNTAFSKCGHLCMCNQCAVSYKKQTAQGSSRRGRSLCPICRDPITSLLRIYY